MLTGAHAILYSSNADAERAFFRAAPRAPAQSILILSALMSSPL
jgi:hypothetical protein